MSEASDSVRLGKRPQREAQPDLVQDVTLEENDPSDSSNSQSNPKELPSIAMESSTLTTQSQASTPEDGPSYGLPDPVFLPWGEDVSSDHVSLDRQLIGESDSPSPELPNLNTPKRDRHTSEIQLDRPTERYTFPSNVIDALEKLLKMKIDDSILFPVNHNEDREDGNTRMEPVEKSAGKGTDVDTQGEQYGNEPQAASVPGDEAATKLLPKKAADMNEDNKSSMTPLQRAAEQGHVEIMKLLLERAAQTKEDSKSSKSAISAAAATQSRQIIEPLLEDNAERNSLPSIFVMNESRDRKEGGNTFYLRSVDPYNRSPSPGPSTSNTEAVPPSEVLRCPVCSSYFTGRYARGNLGRHRRQIHGYGRPPVYVCEAEGCGKSFARGDACRKHHKVHHSELYNQQGFLESAPAQEIKHLQRDAPAPPEMNIFFEPPNLQQLSDYERTSLTNANLSEEGDDEIGRYYLETVPASPSYASSVASIFSEGSLASSATGLSRSSGYSAGQIASATKLLLSVFQEDASLLPLYKNAMDNPYIGPDRLRRNLRRIFKTYSKQLEAESTERLEFLTSRLVMMKSGLLADSIVEKLQKAQVAHSVSDNKHRHESSDDDEEESSEACPVNEEAFDDLEVFREFLVQSEAFQNLHTQVQVFVTGKSTQTADTSIIENKKLPEKDAVRQSLAISATQARRSLTWENWVKDVMKTIDGLLRYTGMTNAANAMMFLFADAFMLATDGIFIALGQLEPPLRPGMTRLRWRCNCGDRLYSDVLELYAGGIFELTGHMQRTSGAKVHVSSYNQQSSGQQYIVPRPGQWIRNAWRKMMAALGRPTQPPASLPQHNTQCHSNASSASNNQPRQEILHLMACMHRNRVRICLNQDRIEGVTTDRTLLCFLRRQYVRHRGSILHLFSLKTITGLWFVKFWLPIGGSVSIRHHERCCMAAASASMLCECIPPAPKVEPSPGAEYRCIPGPPATYPPIPPEYLSSLITCPTDVHEKDTWILDQLPKRMCGELQGQIGKPAEGWGVYYQEGWDRDIITLVILVVFFAASLLFGILWSRYHFDIQGAFGVSAYIMAFCAVLIHVLSNQADKAA